MILKRLIGDVKYIRIEGNTEIDITDIVYDSRKAKKDNMFVAIDGFKVDGHNFVLEAVKQGAKVVVVEKDIVIEEKGITKILVENTRKALAELSALFYDSPSKSLELIGITGTNGKTTTTYLLKSILEQQGRKPGLIGTIGNVINDKLEKTTNTTPESLDLQKSFRSMLNHNIDTCIMEVSSHSLELNRVDGCDFNIGLFTNFSPDHLGFHKTLDNYLNAKSKLFYKTTHYNIINNDDVYGKKIIEKVKSLKTPIITYGINEEADIRAIQLVNAVEGVSFTLRTAKGQMKIKMNIPGTFSVYNALSAAACAYAMGVGLEEIKTGLEDVKGVKGRFEVIPTNQDFSVIIDFAHTPDGMEKVLETVNEFAEGRKVIIFGAGGDRDKSKRPGLGEVAGKYCDLCIVTSDNSRSEDPDLIIKDVIEGVKKVNGNYISIVDRKEAIKYAIVNSQPKDTILLVGKGHETYQIIGDQVLPFDEKEIVLKTIEEVFGEELKGTL